MKKYWTMITKGYVEHWTVPNGAREYISNALDGEAPFEYEIGEDFIILTSVGITLPATIFTLGFSKNREDEDAVGTFGEGSLIGLIPLLREGKGVCFINGSVTWRPAFEYNEALGIEVLVINEEENHCSENNYSVVIDNLTPDEIQEIRESCVYFRDDLGEVLDGHIGQVIKGIQGKLFVGGIFVCSIPKHVFSYNFKSKYLPLNRDRQSINAWDLGVQTQRLLDEVESAQGIAKLIIDKSPDVYYSKFGVDLPVAEAVFNDFVEVHGNKVVAADWMEAGRLKDEGYEDVFVTGNEAMTKAIQKSTGYKEFLQTVDKLVEEVDNTTPLEMLEAWYDDVVMELPTGHAQCFEELLDIFRSRGVSFDD